MLAAAADIDDEGDASSFGHLHPRPGSARIDADDNELPAIVISSSARARAASTPRLVSLFMIERDEAAPSTRKIAGRDPDAALTVLADAGFDPQCGSRTRTFRASSLPTHHGRGGGHARPLSPAAPADHMAPLPRVRSAHGCAPQPPTGAGGGPVPVAGKRSISAWSAGPRPRPGCAAGDGHDRSAPTHEAAWEPAPKAAARWRIGRRDR